MCKFSLFCLFVLLACNEAVLAMPSHTECSGALYKGLYQTFGVLNSQVRRLIKEGKLDRGVKPTCELMSVVKNSTLARFHDSGCKFGVDDTSSALFESRLFSLLGGLIEEDCEAFSTDIEDDSVGFYARNKKTMYN